MVELESSFLLAVLLRSSWLLLLSGLLGTVLLKLLTYVIEPVQVRPQLHYRSSSLSKLLLDTLPWLTEVTSLRSMHPIRQKFSVIAVCKFSGSLEDRVLIQHFSYVKGLFACVGALHSM